MKQLISQMMSQVELNYQNNVFWVVIQRNLESILLAGCLEKERNYEVISEPKKVVKKLLRKLNRNYSETIHAKEYAAQLNKEKVLSRVSGTKEFQNYLKLFLPTS